MNKMQKVFLALSILSVPKGSLIEVQERGDGIRVGISIFEEKAYVTLDATTLERNTGSLSSFIHIRWHDFIRRMMSQVAVEDV